MIFRRYTDYVFLLFFVPSAISVGRGSRRKHHNIPYCHPAVSDTTPEIPSSQFSTIVTPTSHESPTKSILSTATRSTTTTPITTVAPPPKNNNLYLTPNGIKAGIAGGDAYPFMEDHIGWWYDWSPNPSKPGRPIGVPMLWGGGTADATDAARLAQFKKIQAPPTYVLAYEEPDCASGSGSAGMSVSAGIKGWESWIVPLAEKGSILGSPSMCKQADETWLGQFERGVSKQWDFTAVHINKNTLEGVKQDIDHYWNTYKKPIWVTEFACVNDINGFAPCTDQREINDFINQIVPYLETHDKVFAYAYSNGLGLGDVWPLMKDGALSASGRTFLAAIKKYH